MNDWLPEDKEVSGEIIMATILFGLVFSPFLRDWHEYSNGFSGINVDISENENEYTLTADCPGCKQKTILTCP